MCWCFSYHFRFDWFLLCPTVISFSISEGLVREKLHSNLSRGSLKNYYHRIGVTRDWLIKSRENSKEYKNNRRNCPYPRTKMECPKNRVCLPQHWDLELVGKDMTRAHWLPGKVSLVPGHWTCWKFALRNSCVSHEELLIGGTSLQNCLRVLGEVASCS